VKKKDLHIKFEEAVESINSMEGPYPADLLLRLYAYYKKATQNEERPSSRKPLVNAFKTNALIQVGDIDETKAKKEYIKLVEAFKKKQG
jgi:acyl-CoA-binding protein